jgi:hypothetical protein
VQILHGEFLNQGLRFALRWKPGRPNLYRHSLQLIWATRARWVQQQITQPPRASTIRQSDTKEPRFITAASGEAGKRLVEALYQQDTTPVLRES